MLDALPLNQQGTGRDSANHPNTPGIERDPENQPIVKRKAVSNAKQAFSIVTAWDSASRERWKKSGLVEQKYNGTAPFNARKLKEAKQDWRYNIGTGFLSSYIDRRKPDLVRIVETALTLTNAGLPPKFQDAEQKSIKFRKRFTKVIRAWAGWREFLNAAAQETLLHGYCAAGWTDMYDWRPEFFNNVDFSAPDGVSIRSEEAEGIAFRKWFKPGKMVDKIIEVGQEAATLAGWNVENVLKAVNEAQPKNKRAVDTYQQYRQFADMERESSLWLSYSAGEMSIECYDAFFQEIDGTATQYLLRKSDGLELFCRENAYPSMGYVTQFLTIETGNNTLFGSRGLGRKLFNFHVGNDKATNMFLDLVHMNSLKMFKMAPDKAGVTKRPEFVVQAPFAFLFLEGELIEFNIKDAKEGFVEARQMLTEMAEAVAGTVLPNRQNMVGNGEKITATQATIEAEREQMLQAAALERWAIQVSDITSIMQRRLCDPDSPDKTAKEFQQELMETDGFTPEEIEYIAKQPAANTVTSSTQLLRNQIKEILLTYAANPTTAPFINTKKLVTMDIEALMDETTADSILTDVEDTQGQMTKAARDQIIEFGTMMEGDEIPVDLYDLHKTHLDTIKELILKHGQGVTPLSMTPEMVQGLGRTLSHGDQHVAAWKSQGGDPKEIMPYEQGLKQFAQMVQQATQARAQIEQKMAETQPTLPSPQPQGLTSMP